MGARMSVRYLGSGGYRRGRGGREGVWWCSGLGRLCRVL